jgi:hypothetical protein
MLAGIHPAGATLGSGLETAGNFTEVVVGKNADLVGRA